MKLRSYTSVSCGILSIRCPGCRRQGTLDALAKTSDIASNDGLHFGQRRCPNPDCRQHIFIVYRGLQVILSYPAERLDFDSSNVPQAVTKALSEAIACHAHGSFVASAIMVRKTLEELCHERGATGKTLKDRLTSLSTKVVLPRELFEGMDHLRLLGNDAAHIESQTYAQVSKEETEVGILFAKEVLKAVYQYANLVQQLKALKK